MTIRTRMAPSPTGEMHIGSMAILLKNYAYAKKNKGQFVLRIEDTDKVREIENGVELITSIIKKFGLVWDEGPQVGGPHQPYIQSQRLELYQQYAQELLDKGKAYYCFATPQELADLKQQQKAAGIPPRYDGRYRDFPVEEAKQRVAAGEPHVIRLKVPQNQVITFDDEIRGQITVNSNDVTDQVLLKSDGYPTYHLAVVVDDHLMGINYIMRGEEWISSTPKHILLYQAFGWEIPKHAHIPVFLNPDGKGKMSKRKGTVSAQSFLDRGYLVEAVLNFLMILGWTPQDQREILSLEEYIQEFEPQDVSPNSVAFDIVKLDWINGQYIRRLSASDLTDRLTDFIPSDCPDWMVNEIVPLIHERLVRLDQFEELSSFFYRTPEYNPSILLKKSEPAEVARQLEVTATTLADIEWTESSIETAIRAIQAEYDWSKKQYFMMLRQAVTGQKATPPLFETIKVIGQNQTLARLATALQAIS